MWQKASHGSSAVVLRDDIFQISPLDIGRIDSQSLCQSVEDEDLVGVLRLDRINFCDRVREIQLLFADHFEVLVCRVGDG